MIDASTPAIEPAAASPGDVEPIISDEAIDALEPGTDEFTKIVQSLEHYGAKFPPWFCDQPVEAVRAGLKKAARSEKVRETYQRKKAIEAARRPPIPTIYIMSDVPGMSEQALDAIRQANADRPEVFARSGEMVALHYDEQRQRVILKSVDKETLRGILMRCATWLRTKVNKDGTVDEMQTTPPGFVLEDILSMSPHHWQLPIVKGVVEVPIVRLDGSIWVVPGYDERSKLIYHPTEDLAGFHVPDQPTPDDVSAAVDLLNEMVHDFPWYGEQDAEVAGAAKYADRANAVAAMITQVARPLIAGPVPAYLVDKPAPRTGASLLQELMYTVLTGQAPTMKPTPESNEEFRKYITGELAAGTSIVLLDNIEQRLKAPALATIITAPAWRDRKMGSNAIVDYENRLFWLLNGNNVQLSPDLAPRCFYSRLDARMARPGEREEFLHSDIRRWVKENRARLLRAVYVLIRAWIVTGRPAPEKLPKLGSFENWVSVVGGVLHHTGIEGFMANQTALYDAADQSAVQWDTFLLAVHRVFRGPFTVAEVADRLEVEDKPGVERILSPTLPEELDDGRQKGGHAFRTRIGRAFTRKRDVVFPSGAMLKKGGVAHGGGTAWIVRTKQEPDQLQMTIKPSGSGEGGEDVEAKTSTPCEDPKWYNNSIGGEITSPPSPPSPLPPIPSGCLKHPIEAYAPRKYDSSILCIVPGCRRHAEYAAGAGGFPLCEGHFQAAKRQAARQGGDPR